jgi:hypothetical protein
MEHTGTNKVKIKKVIFVPVNTIMAHGGVEL